MIGKNTGYEKHFVNQETTDNIIKAYDWDLLFVKASWIKS